jgi:dihydropteroate synthase
MLWHTSSGSLSLEEPRYLGILNITPDSFSDGGRFLAPDRAVAQAQALVASGSDFLDVGAESTRPGARSIDSAEEWSRLESVLEGLRAEFPKVPISLDSRHAPVALKGLGRGVAILNDVGGFSDEAMLDLARSSRCGLIAMRSRREEGQLVMPSYDDPAPRDAETAWAELRAIRRRLLEAGIDPERVLLDPGFGFGTTYREDLALWESLPRLAEAIDWPPERICIAVSRKRFLARRAGRPELPPDQRDELTESAHAEARTLGFKVFRTHALPAPGVRPATIADAPGLARIHVDSWRAAYRGMLPETFLKSLSAAEKEATIRELIQAPPGPARQLLALERAGRLLGFAAIGPAPEDSGQGIGEVYAVYLAPSAWGRGHGRLLMTHALAGLRSTGFGEAVLWVMERNARARRFYQAGGWLEDGGSRTQWHGGIAIREVRYRLGIQNPASPEKMI